MDEEKYICFYYKKIFHPAMICKSRSKGIQVALTNKDSGYSTRIYYCDSFPLYKNAKHAEWLNEIFFSIILVTFNYGNQVHEMAKTFLLKKGKFGNKHVTAE